MRILKNCRAMTATGVVEGDVLLEAGRIASVGGVIARAGAAEHDARGRFVLPGVIDPHVHLREPGLTHKETLATGSAAAVTGGVTSFLEMPNTVPPAVDQAALDEKLAIAARTSYANYGFYVAAALDNVEALARVERCPGIKIFVGSSTGNLLVDDQTVLERIFAETTLPICTHCEEESLVQANAARLRAAGASEPAIHSAIRTPEAAALSVARIGELALRHRHRTHILHLSTRAELAALEALGPLPEPDLVTAEVCIPHLFLDTGDYERLGNFAKVNPSLREPAEREAMWSALHAGRFALVATDHAPHLPAEKARGYWEAPSGIPSLENSLPLMLDAVNRGGIELRDVVRWMCEGPARVWGLAGKGAIEEGADADLVVVDMAREQTIENAAQVTRAGWSPWAGRRVRGWPVVTIVGGEVVVVEGEIVGEPRGRALRFAR